MYILTEHGGIDDIDPLVALSYIGDNTNICDIGDENLFYNYLEKVISDYTIKGNKYKVAKNLSEMSLIYKEKEALDYKNRFVTIDNDKICDLCKKKIGGAMFVVYPNLKVCHSKCATNPSVDPTTGINFTKKNILD